MSDYEDAIESLDEVMGLGEGLRRRPLWDPETDSLDSTVPGLQEVTELLEDDDSCVLGEEDDGVGCPLPSTPEDEHLLDCEITEVLKAGVLSDEIDLGALAHNAAEQAEEFVRKVWEASWKVCHFHNLPQWLQDNDYLHAGHRPPLPSFYACFKSIFRIHTETGNIWTHLLGCVAFIAVATYFLTRPSVEIQFQEKLVFAAFFAGAIMCLGMSFAFHTVHCHSECVGKLFSKLDYCGIAMLIMGSFVPWLYYGFYCHYQPKIIYLSVVICLGISSIVVSLWDRFSLPKYRPLRAGVFMTFGLSGVIPAVHYAISEGWFNAISQASLGWLILMGCLYILGAMFYALRVPERFFPGKCDIWFQSHQIFHVLVIAAAFVHYHGITEMAMYRMTVAFRSLVRKYDCDLCFSPMIIANSFVISEKARNNEFSTNKGDRPLVVQFAANSVDDFTRAAELVAPYCDGVDLNCGCPQRWAMKEGYGVDLLERPEHIRDMVLSVRNRISQLHSISVKLRLLTDLRKTVELCRCLEHAGVTFITVHARTPDQRHQPINVTALQQLRQSVALPVVANGDVRTLQGAAELQEATGCQGVMSARGLLTNPALFSGLLRTPLDCVRHWVSLTTHTGASFQTLHHHLVFMLEKVLSRDQRLVFNSLKQRDHVLSFLQEHLGVEGCGVSLEEEPVVCNYGEGSYFAQTVQRLRAQLSTEDCLDGLCHLYS